MKKIAIGLLAALAALLALAELARAQTVAGDRFTLNTGPCTIRSGAGAPEGRQTGKVCDIYIRTDGTGAAIVYVKDSGTGSTGWQTLTPGIPLDPTPGKVLVSGSPVSWTSSPSLTSITGAADLTFNPAGNVITNPAGRTIAPGLGYTTSIGTLTKKYLTLHAAELWVETLVAQQTLATIGGRVVVAPTNILARDVAPGDSVIYVKYNSFLLHAPGVELGSKLFLESAGKFEVMSVLTTTPPAPEADGSYAYTVERNSDGSGANQWYAGDAILDTGKTNNGAMIDLYATRGVVSGSGPAIVGSVRVNGNYNALAPRFALGNLNGVGYGHTSDIYGFAAGDPNGPNIFADAVNGVHLRQGTTARVSLYPDGRAYFVGDGNGVTNINGGNIAARSITADKVAANAITVAELNASGFGDNLIKNGNFEGPDQPSSLAGWAKDQSSSAVPIVAGCCGLAGPGTLYLEPGDGTYMSAGYLASPVNPGETYRVSLKVYAGQTSAIAMHVLITENNSTTRGVRRVTNSPSSVAPDVPETSHTFLAINQGLPSGWSTLEWVYTVPAGVNWVSLVVYDLSGAISGSVYTGLHFDDISMTRQIGAGSIKANAITADKIAAGSITADKISSGTSSNVLANSECRTGTSDWWLAGNSGLPVAFSYNYPGWSLLAEPSVCYISWLGTSAPSGTYLQAVSKEYPAIAGHRYEASVYLGLHRANGVAFLQFLDVNGNGTGSYIGPWCAAANNGGPDISNYCRSGLIVTAPPNTARYRMIVHSEYVGGTQEVTFFVRAFLGEAKPNQTELSEWNPAGLTEINGGLITTGAIQANHIAAGAITAGKIAARSITANEIATGTISANEIGARAISADRIAVGALTSTEIAARSIVADRIAGGAITGTEIAGGTISGGHIAGNTITGGNIAGNTITGDKITAGAITADKIAADAINGKTITGVTIYGSTIYAGSGNQVTLDGSGISIAQGGASENKLKWSGGGAIWSNSNTIQFETQQGHFNGHLEVSGYIFAGAAFPGGGGEYVMYNAGCGCFARYASSVRYKENIRPWSTIDPLALLRVPLVRYDYKMPSNAPPGFKPDRNVVGLLVEDLIKLAPDAVILDAQGRPDAIRGGALDIYLIAALKAEDARIAELERRLLAAEAALRKIGGGK